MTVVNPRNAKDNSLEYTAISLIVVILLGGLLVLNAELINALIITNLQQNAAFINLAIRIATMTFVDVLSLTCFGCFCYKVFSVWENCDYADKIVLTIGIGLVMAVVIAIIDLPFYPTGCSIYLMNGAC